MSDPVVQLTQVSKIYSPGQAEVRALDGVDLSIDAGQFVVLLGPSGCGKSTLLNAIGGLDSPTAGTVVIDGTDISSLTDAQLTRFRRQKIGFIFQFFNLVQTLSAKENIQLAGELVDEPRSLAQVLKDVRLEDRADHVPNQLSGGEQQRVAIARALIKNPPLLLCDEPTGELDIATGRMILSLLRTVTRESSQTVLLVTHNTAIAKMSDRVLFMRDGRIVEDQVNEAPLDPEEIDW
jgi:putative ABC transport system ATP-binding protein